MDRSITSTRSGLSRSIGKEFNGAVVERTLQCHQQCIRAKCSQISTIVKRTYATTVRRTQANDVAIVRWKPLTGRRRSESASLTSLGSHYSQALDVSDNSRISFVVFMPPLSLSAWYVNVIMRVTCVGEVRFLKRVRIARNAERCTSYITGILFVCLRPSRSGIVSRRMKIRSCGF